MYIFSIFVDVHSTYRERYMITLYQIWCWCN